MTGLVLKVLLSGALVVGASEAARRSTVVGAIIVSLPLTSILALFWLYRDTNDSQQVADFSIAIMWIVLPSVVLFMTLPLLLRWGLHFYVALPVSCVVMAGAYAVYAALARKVGLDL